MNKRTIVQIAVAMQSPQMGTEGVRDEENELRVVALCDDGSVWQIQPDERTPRWFKLPEIPQH